jgi:hypothetical protein
MIKFSGNTINDWRFDASDINKMYRNDTVIYLKAPTPTPTGQTPCFDVVDDISQYSDTEFEDVYASGNTTWYKLNNLSQYEEYGVYDTTTATTYYDGKLVIMNGHEYEYSGGSWNDIGEITGSSRLPMGYAEIEYVENTSTAFINTGFKPNQNTRIVLTTQCVTSTSGGRHIGAGGYDGVNTINFDYETGAQGTLHISWGGYSGWATYQYYGDYNVHTYDWDGNEFWIDKGTANEFYVTTGYTTYQCTDDLAIFTRYQNGGGGGSSECFRGKVFDFQMYDNGTLVRDLVPAKRESDSTYGAYDIVNDVFYSSANNYALTGGSEVSPIEYPEYYTDKTAPPNNVTFTSMTEAESYECPWVGMRATIDGSGYTFSGDAIGGYEWVYTPSRLPAGYTEIEYLEAPNTSEIPQYMVRGDAYIDTNFKPNQDTRIVCVMQTVWSVSYGRLCGAGNYNGQNGYQFDYESGAQGSLHISWGTIDGWTTYQYYGDYNVHTYDWDKNNFYVDKGTANQFSATTTFGNFQCTDNLGIFANINGRAENNWYGRMYSFQIYDDGVLVRDFVPCIQDSTSIYGAYDVVNGVFYSSSGNDQFIGGNPV